jgi:phosphatidylglycerol:prolipoprotein diacylglycerol transferase
VGFWTLTDFIAPLVTIGLGAGRIGNYINSELWGKATDVPWAVIVDGVPRHASQLYEAFLEGLVLFIILWVFASKERPRMAVSAMFLLCYGVFRFGVEFVRVPDEHIGYLAWGWFTQGQLLTAPMIIGGIVLLMLAYRNPVYAVSKT